MNLPHMLITLVLAWKRLPHYSSHGHVAARTAGEGAPMGLNLQVHRLVVALEIRASGEGGIGAAIRPVANPFV